MLMPVVLRWRGHRFLFSSMEVGEPPHIHVLKDAKQLKVWLSAPGAERGFCSARAE
jgi:hypothetical protein